ncbi:MAG: hypothetical protein HYV63_06615 [Candidatus Schekmanbacteria bacterium]|nr:hypothetical protein [Candidatus Schekmanbacteria bacterium]
MNENRFLPIVLPLIAILVSYANGAMAAAVGTSFTYQGLLSTGNGPVTGTCDLDFRLFDSFSTGSQIGTTFSSTGVEVSEGRFTVSLDFGAGAFDGNERWLELAVACPSGSGTPGTLSPRQALTAAPYAIYSQKAATASQATDSDTVDGKHASEFATTTHAHAGEQITSGTVAEARIDASLTRDSEVLGTILAGDGPGSGLDADTVDGKQAEGFASSDHTHPGGGPTEVDPDQLTGDTLDNDLLDAAILGTHSHAGTDISSGTVTEARTDSTIARDSEILPTVLAGDGTGSTLDADKLDGADSTAFAAASHAHSGSAITSGTVADAYIASTIARDSEILSTVLAGDGAGSTLDADKLDGADSTDFLGATSKAADADKLDGADSTAFAAASHAHSGSAITSGTVADAYIDSTIARDSEIMSTVLAGDGSGSTVDGDTVDGLHASAIPTAGTLLALDSNAKIPVSALPTYGTTTPGTDSSFQAFENVADRDSVSITIGTDGLPVLVYGGSNVKVTHCEDLGCTTRTTTTISSSAADNVAIAIGVDNNPVVAYRATSDSTLYVATCIAATCATYNTPLAIATDVAGYVNLVISGGEPLLSYYSSSNTALKSAYCNDASCTSGAVNSVIAIASGGSNSMVVGLTGLPMIAFQSSGNLYLGNCSDSTCTSFSTSPALASGTNVGAYPSLTIGTDGVPIVSYVDFDTDPDILKVRRCDNADCSSLGTIYSVDLADSETMAAGYSSIGVAANGLPVIAYTTSTSNEVNFAVCHTFSCSTSSTTQLTTTEVDSISYTLGPDGLPILAYTTFSSPFNEYVYVRRCTNEFCSDYFRRR